MSDTPTSAIVGSTPPVAGGLSIGMSPMDMLIHKLKIQWCNVRLDSAQGRKLLQACISDPTIGSEDRTREDWSVVAALLRGPSGCDPQTGEEYTSPVTTLLTADGRTMTWASPYVADSLAVLCMLRPAGVWDPPILTRCRGIRCGNGHTRYVIEEVESVVTPTKKGGR